MAPRFDQMPCVTAFFATVDLPAGVLGPVDTSALFRFAANCISLIIVRPPILDMTFLAPARAATQTAHIIP